MHLVFDGSRLPSHIIGGYCWKCNDISNVVTLSNFDPERGTRNNAYEPPLYQMKK
jgi:hypothetical protein